MKNKHSKKFILIFLLIFFVWPIFSFAQTAPAPGSFDYTPLEPLPGFEAETSKPVDFYSYISMVYQIGIWSIGMMAMFMIIFGGFTYITAAGNTSSMGKGKTIITDAIIGLLLAMVSYLVLYVINPDLIKLQRLEPGEQTRQAEKEATGKYDGSSYPIVNSKLPQDCNNKEWQTIFNEVSVSSGIDKCILMATAAKESQCNQRPARTENGRDCSVMQIAASLHCNTTCDDLEQNPKKAVECAAKYLKYDECSASLRKNPPEQFIRDTYAAYRGGCGALQPSESCAGKNNELGNPFQKWDCPIKCGELCNVPSTTSTFLDYYRQCKGS